MDWLSLFRDGLFCLFTIILLLYVAQCYIYEEQIKKLTEKNEDLEEKNEVLRDILQETAKRMKAE